MNDEFENLNEENKDMFQQNTDPELEVEELGQDDSDYASEPDEAPSTKNGGRIFARILCALLAVALVSFTSIQAYRYLLPTNTPGNPSAPQYVRPANYQEMVAVKEADNGELSTVDIAEKVRPSIVTVVCTVQSTSSRGTIATGTSSGSGVIATADGYIITNYHVIEGSVSIEIYLSDDSKYVATVVGGDALSDLAVLKIDASNLPYAEFGNSDELRVGERAIAIGNPLGLSFAGTVTQGIISALDRQVQVDSLSMTLIQTDASINNGNSGGALVNGFGQVVGITSSKISLTYAEGLAFAIPSNDVVKVANDLINLGYVSGRPYLGVTGESVTFYMQMYYRVPAGVNITSIKSGSPADLAGLRTGDIICAVNDVAISTYADLNSIVNRSTIGDKITLKVYSYNAYKDVTITLAEYRGE